MPDAERPDIFLYTDEGYLNEHDELKVLSRHYRGRRSHTDYLRAIEHLDVYILDGDSHSRLPYRNGRYRLYCALPLRLVRVEVSHDIHDLSLAAS